jgi:hypothetical protein
VRKLSDQYSKIYLDTIFVITFVRNVYTPRSWCLFKATKESYKKTSRSDVRIAAISCGNVLEELDRNVFIIISFIMMKINNHVDPMFDSSFDNRFDFLNVYRAEIFIKISYIRFLGSSHYPHNQPHGCANNICILSAFNAFNSNILV